MTDFTHREVVTLTYLNPLMEANARMIGEAIIRHGASDSGDLIRVGAAVCGRLRKRGYVTFLSDLRAWRITAAGRIALKAESEA